MTGSVFSGVLGQERAVHALEAAAARPVHAYLLVGPPGTGKRAAATAFAAALLCAATARSGRADGTCESCRRALAGIHPDVVEIEREGPSISIGAARDAIRTALTSPLEGSRKVVVLHDFHLVRDAAPALLKTVEEPPASTIFVILAEHLPPELVTIASRCVQVEFSPLAPDQVEAVLVREGVEPLRAAALAEASSGRMDRARLLAADPQFEARRQAWRAVAARLDGAGATAATVADELIAHLDASVEVLVAHQAQELESLQSANERAAEVVGTGKGAKRPKAAARSGRRAAGPGARELEERHKRELRRQRTDELRFGLATLAATYRERLASAPDSRRRAAAAESVDHVDEAARDLTYNPGELLLVQALLVRLGRTALKG